MLAKLRSAAVCGIEGISVGVELDLSNGLPSFQTVGLPDCSVREARDRVYAAIRNSGFDFPNRRVTVNLAPAEERKGGTQLDLPIGLGLLLASGQLPGGAWSEKCCFLGELALDGTLQAVSGVLPMALAAAKAGIVKVIVPEANLGEAAVAGLSAHGARSLRDIVEHIRGERRLSRLKSRFRSARREFPQDLKNVKGQLLARRALSIAAAGGHNLLMIGPPGTGKSMLAGCLPGILPELSPEEALEVTSVLSVAARVGARRGLERFRPFRSPHTTASSASLIGGGTQAKPGEVTLAHHGVLFLDELPEFQRSALEALRQPVEDRTVTVARVRRTVTYPSDFMLVAAMNPCPCGFYGAGDRCECRGDAVRRYRSRISGPLLDRIDLQVELSPLPYSEWAGRGEKVRSSAEVREEVARVRSLSLARSGTSNARIPGEKLKELCGLDRGAWDFVEWAATKRGFSPRVLDRMLRVSRTIADLDGKKTVGQEHVCEALQYRIRWLGSDGNA